MCQILTQELYYIFNSERMNSVSGNLSTNIFHSSKSCGNRFFDKLPFIKDLYQVSALQAVSHDSRSCRIFIFQFYVSSLQIVFHVI
jgi:hypothetical protein